LKTRPYFLKNFPPMWVVLIFVTIVGGSYLLDIGWHDRVFHPFRMLFICLLPFVFGMWRVIAFYPNPVSSYGKWLTLTPWKYGMPLPKGSVQLNIADLIVMAVFAGATFLDKQIHFLVPVFIFLYAYIITAILSTLHGIPIMKYWIKRLLILAIIPIGFYPVLSITSVTVSIALCYILCYCHLRDVLKAFPWNQSLWLEKDEDILSQKSLKYAETGWPYSALAATSRKFFCIGNKIFTITVLSGLVVWWLHSIILFLFNMNDNGGESGICIFLLIVLGVLAISVRLYFLQGTVAPISFFGRLFKGYFIIPKFDKIFVAPLCIGIFVVLPIYFMPELVESAIWLFDGSVFVILVICAGCPPSINQWRNTGGFTMTRNKLQEKQLQQIQLQGNGLNKPIGEIFTGK
jgi:hypothetical protein